jgi:hypothetical protein
MTAEGRFQPTLAMVLLSILLWLAVPRPLLPVAFACQDRLDSLLLTRFQIESVSFNFFNDFLLQNLALEASQRILQSFTILNVDFGQPSPPYSWQYQKNGT